MRDRALAVHQYRTLIWALLAPHRQKPGKPPEAHPILKEPEQ